MGIKRKALIISAAANTPNYPNFCNPPIWGPILSAETEIPINVTPSAAASRKAMIAAPCPEQETETPESCAV